MPLITYRQALNEALAEEIERDENVVLIGEEVAEYNGAYKVTEGLWAKYGDKRVVDAPISEAGFIGMGVGASMLGVRPVMELMFWSFAYVAMDQMINNAATVRYMSGGLINCPIVVRGPANGGTNVGATHSHTPENLFASMPGLKVVVPATAYDAKGLMKAAIRDDDPVYVMENTLLYGEKWEVPTNDELEEGELVIPLGVADLKREGTDLSIIAHGRCVIESLKAAEVLKHDHGLDVEVLDLRSIRPLDEDAILATVRKTNNVLLVDENRPFCGVSSMIATIIQEKAFDDLDGPIMRVNTIDAPAIYSPGVEPHQLPNVDRIVAKVLDMQISK
ncbi:alpha-ketoacid dehydrogenase subunit beta [Sulfuriroseicoccus oceanibius]|uniref:Alpha-ketoacid dehydrogenase subunit beta n=1 Tax=Sulfuriroseicoccus oceanibius TaxID=2707525 RepID=A0A6B3LEB8_9BACT|nr:alpha-ketoacid dehydrogenase subunit beta [Sulfuriroseicoccus oceanibius]QQL45361.1 alpha-ketoacid dehydrogenase subunit beta [Sulfuriroseicoccus oceanibius]